jgi:hypothetical protein
MSLKEIIAAAVDLPREKDECPEWNQPVWVSMMLLADRRAWNKFAFDENGKGIEDKIYERLLVFCLTDEAKNRIFDDPAEGIEILSRKNPDIIKRLFGIAIRLNGIGSDQAADIEKK